MKKFNVTGLCMPEEDYSEGGEPMTNRHATLAKLMNGEAAEVPLADCVAPKGEFCRWMMSKSLLKAANLYR